MEKRNNKQKLPPIGREKTEKFRETTWLSAFHLFGLSTELALTFQPSLSEFQFAFTAQSRFVQSTFHATTLRNTLGVVSYSESQLHSTLHQLFCFLPIRLCSGHPEFTERVRSALLIFIYHSKPWSGMPIDYLKYKERAPRCESKRP